MQSLIQVSRAVREEQGKWVRSRMGPTELCCICCSAAPAPGCWAQDVGGTVSLSQEKKQDPAEPALKTIIRSYCIEIKDNLGHNVGRGRWVGPGIKLQFSCHCHSAVPDCQPSANPSDLQRQAVICTTCTELSVPRLPVPCQGSDGLSAGDELPASCCLRALGAVLSGGIAAVGSRMLLSSCLWPFLFPEVGLCEDLVLLVMCLSSSWLS